MQRQYVRLGVGIREVEPGLGQNPSSVAERVKKGASRYTGIASCIQEGLDATDGMRRGTRIPTLIFRSRGGHCGILKMCFASSRTQYIRMAEVVD